MPRFECPCKSRIYVRDHFAQLYLETLTEKKTRSRDGTNLSFFELLTAIAYVYNISYPLATLITVGGFLTCGKIQFGKASTSNNALRESSEKLSEPSPMNILLSLPSYLPRVTLDLGSLAERGFFKIAHNASLVHPRDVESTSPHPGLVALFIATACRNILNSASLASIARFHGARLKSQPIDPVHDNIARGECALAFLALRGQYVEVDPAFITPRRPKMSPGIGGTSEMEAMKVNRKLELEKHDLRGSVPAERLEQWFDQERLPDGWWPDSEDGSPGVRSTKTIGLIQAVTAANMIKQIIDQAMIPSSRKDRPVNTPVIKYPISQL